MNCYVHPDVDAVATCVGCGKAVCGDCATTTREGGTDKVYCPQCNAANQASGLAPCPQCGSRSASKVSYTWWGGLIGPRLLNHVRCATCGATYNSKTGKSNTTSILIYFAVVLGIALACSAACLIVTMMGNGG